MKRDRFRKHVVFQERWFSKEVSHLGSSHFLFKAAIASAWSVTSVLVWAQRCVMGRGWYQSADGWWQRSIREPRPPSEQWPHFSPGVPWSRSRVCAYSQDPGVKVSNTRTVGEVGSVISHGWNGGARSGDSRARGENVRDRQHRCCHRRPGGTSAVNKHPGNTGWRH